MLNGSGLRVVLWLSGCDHNCENCQNPQTHNPNSGIVFDKDSERELFEEIDKNYISGLTITGGDPLYHNNLEDVMKIITKFREKYNVIKQCEIDSLCKKNIWIYTGYTWEEIFSDKYEKNNLRQEIIKNCDVVVDGRYIESLRDTSLHWRGSSNQRVIDIKETLKKGEIVVCC